MRNLSLLNVLLFTLIIFPNSINSNIVVPQKQDGILLQKEIADKVPLIFYRGDCEVTVGGKFKVEHYFDRNAYLLNKNIPDENEYFKNSIDLNFDFVYGKQKYDHNVIEFFTNIRHKGIWGYAVTYADPDSGPIAPSNIKLADAFIGSHSHQSGKTLLWLSEAWLQFSANAIFNSFNDKLHFLKFGWFPFELGRGIALGAVYGLNKDGFGLYNYPEENGAPGINLHGTLIKNVLDYDVYYAKFDEGSKNFSSTMNLSKMHVIGLAAPWNGINKDDEVVAGRLKWKSFSNYDKYGEMIFEPYIFYNAASDRVAEISSDVKSYWGSYGLNMEYAKNDFEYGAEVAFNYGKQDLYHIDRNKLLIVVDDNGSLVEKFSHIQTNAPGVGVTPILALRNTGNKGADRETSYVNGAQITVPATAFPAPLYNSLNRYRPAYRNTLAGWMTVMDAAYLFKEQNLKASIAYGYISGDRNPFSVEKDKTYHGFLCLHEWYIGKRVPSIFILGQRLITHPVSIAPGLSKVLQDSSVDDLQHVGVGLLWQPKGFVKNLSIHSNVIAFWNVHDSYKFDQTTQKSSTTQLADKFMGTEINLITKCSLLKDLSLFGNFAVFLPGKFFSDVAGIPIGKDFFSTIADDPRNPVDETQLARFRISNNTAYHVNIGLDFKF